MSAPGAFTSRPKLNVAHLPPVALDRRSPIWWGNLLLLIIETTMFAILVSSYFYLRINFHAWPPPRVEVGNIAYNPVPGLKAATFNLALLLLSCIPMFIADRAALKLKRTSTLVALIIVILCGATAVWLRFQEFDALKFSWDDNAYGSVVWGITGMHLVHLVAGTCENGIMALWAAVCGLDAKHARDIRVNAVYWYWIAIIWVPLYAIVFLGPRFY